MMNTGDVNYMKTIVFIGTLKSGSSREAIKASYRLGYFNVLLTDRPRQLAQREEFPDIHHMELVNLHDYEQTKLKISGLKEKGLHIVAIVSFTEPFCHLAARLADEFRVGRFSTEAIAKMENKILSREALKYSSYAPWFNILDNNKDYPEAEIQKLLPFVMKNPKSTGSKEVHLIRTYQDFLNIRNNLLKKDKDTQILIEEFLDGPQYLVETLVVHNAVNIIAVIAQEIDFYNGHFIITGYNLITDTSTPFYARLKMAVRDIIRLHGLTNGPCHLEMRFVKGRWKLIEINPRISGSAMNQIIEIGYGINLVKETIKLAAGGIPDLSPRYVHNTFTEHLVVNETGVLAEVRGRNAAVRSKGVEVVFIKPRRGTLLTPPVSLANRYAYVIATGDNEEDAKTNAKSAAEKIEFVLEPPDTWVSPPLPAE